MMKPLLVFISYARKETRELALCLRRDLQQAGHRVWLDLAEVEGGASWSNEIQQAIDSCDVALALLSASSFTSPICQAEQQYALDLGKRLIPLLAQLKARRPLYLYHLSYRDFSDPAGYAANLEQLLEDLQAAPQDVLAMDAERPASLTTDKGRTAPILPGPIRSTHTGPPPSGRPITAPGPSSRPLHVPAPLAASVGVSTLTQAAELLLTLSKVEPDQYFIELTFSRPDERAERPPVRAPAHFDFPALRQNLPNPSVYGCLLEAAIFSSPGPRSFFETALAVAQSDGLALRLRLLVDPSAPELHELRWEILRISQDGGFLTMNENVLFSRYLYSTDWRRVTLRPRGEMRSLVVVANPTGLERYTPAGRSLAPVDVDGELSRVRQGLSGVDTVDEIPDAPGETGQASLDHIVQCLRRGYDVLYLVCHGALFPKDRQNPTGPKEARLWLEKSDGSVYVAAGNELVERLSDLPPAIRPRLVVLASCQSAGSGRESGIVCSNDQGALAALGPRLAEAGVPAVIAMQGDVLMSTVAAFMPVFFSELTKDGQLERAMAAARGAVRDQPDWWAPVLYTRLKDGQLYAANEALLVAGQLPPADRLPDPGELPPGSRLPFLRNAVFTGREKELLALARHLLYAQPGAVQKVVVTGMGGIGKSELAVEFCYRYGRFISGVHWIEAEQNPMAEIAACGLAMGVLPWPRGLPEQASATVQAWNLVAQRGEKHLVVLDGIEEPGMLQEWLPRLGSVQVLVTSKRAVWPRDLGMAPLNLSPAAPEGGD